MLGDNLMKIGFIGAGTVGTALAYRLSTSGYAVVIAASRTYTSAEKLAKLVNNCRAVDNIQAVADTADFVFITTPDSAIGQVASQITWHPNQYVVHCSGADSTAVLQPAKDQGAQVGAFHPLQTFAGIKQAIDNIPGSTFAVEAEEPLRTILKKMAVQLRGYSIELKAEDKVLYHASAVMACNYLITLIKLSTDLWQSFGVSRTEAVRALLPLLKGTLNNLENIGIPDCLTGPIARGDIGTVKKHLVALDKVDAAVAETYRKLGLQTIPVALAKGKIDKMRASQMEDAIEVTSPSVDSITIKR
jgi:predicted short-subunit dehydrogenase-like oxidoreductase (DUF2520 family)